MDTDGLLTQRELSIGLSVTAALRQKAAMANPYTHQPRMGSDCGDTAMKPSPETLVRNAKCRFGGARKFGFHAVADYRLYCLDGLGKLTSAEWIEAGDDEAAIEVAKKTHDGHQCELWQGKRLVGRLDFRRRT